MIDQSYTQTASHHGNVYAAHHDTVALILAGGRGSRLHELTNWRSKPAVPFGGNSALSIFHCRIVSILVFAALVW